MGREKKGKVTIFHFIQKRYSFNNISLQILVLLTFVKIGKIYLIFFSILGIAKLRQHLSHLRFHRCWLQLECCSYNWLPWISPGTCWKMFGWPETVHIYSDLRLSVFQQRNTIFLKTDIGIEIQYCSLFLSLLFSSMRNFH